MVRASHEGPGLDVPESHSTSKLLQHLELIRMDEPIDRQVIFCRLEILAECKNVAIDFPEIVHDFDDFFRALADAEHHAGLREKTAALRSIQQFQ